MRVVIIEDEFFVAEHLKDLVQQLGHKAVSAYYSGEEFVEKTEWNFDVAVIDVFLAGKMNGIAVAKLLKEKQKPFIFLTANQDVDTIKQAAQLTPAAYLSKPFSDNDVFAALESVSVTLTNNLSFRAPQGKAKVEAKDILFVKADGSYINIQTATSTITQRKLLGAIISELPSYFKRVHRSYLINSKQVDSVSYNHVVLKGFKVPVSRKFKDSLDFL